ncbi:MAG: cysteine rich repeat-containing protein [Methylosarcina sp.]
MNIDKKLSAAVFGLAFSLAACAAPANKNAELVTKPAAKWPVETFFEGCKSEMETYCKDVTLGDNRMLACIYAHEDKLSGRCEFALYEASAQLEHAVAAFSYAADECEDDLEEYCTNVEVGEGRLLACLDRNDAKVSVRCKQALKDVGVKK